MDIAGDAKPFADFYENGLIPDILDLVVSTWNRFVNPDPDELEVPITRRFHIYLMEEKAHRDLPFKIRRELSESDPVSGEEMGRCDLIFDSIRSAKEEEYFAFECKRLRVPYDSGVRTYASEYVGDDGMMCFITGKYGGNAPTGGMIGYVMDSQVGLAIQSVRSTINKNHGRLCLRTDSSLDDCTALPRDNIKETTHELSKGLFIIYHVFLPL